MVEQSVMMVMMAKNRMDVVVCRHTNSNPGALLTYRIFVVVMVLDLIGCTTSEKDRHPLLADGVVVHSSRGEHWIALHLHCCRTPDQSFIHSHLTRSAFSTGAMSETKPLVRGDEDLENLRRLKQYQP